MKTTEPKWMKVLVQCVHGKLACKGSNIGSESVWSSGHAQRCTAGRNFPYGGSKVEEIHGKIVECRADLDDQVGDNTWNMEPVDPTLDDWLGNHMRTHLSACPPLCITDREVHEHTVSCHLSGLHVGPNHLYPYLKYTIPKWDSCLFSSVGKQGRNNWSRKKKKKKTLKELHSHCLLLLGFLAFSLREKERSYL